MKVEEYFEDVQLEIKSQAEALGDYEQVAFTHWALNRLAEANEVIDLSPSQYEGTGKNKRRLRIDAYGYDSVDDSLVCVISDYSGDRDLDTLTKTEASSLFGQLKGFVETALDEERIYDFEHSSEAAQAALELQAKYGAASKIKLYLVTNRILSDRLRALPSEELKLKRVEYYLWDIERFLSNVAESSEAKEVEIDLTEWMPQGLPALRGSDGNSEMITYLMVVPGKLLGSIYDKHGSRLLEGNVRSFLSLRGAVNKGIRSTILREPERFLAYNNGLSTTATGVDFIEQGGITLIKSIKGLQIVNGGQTTASLFTFMRHEKAQLQNLEDVFVQMKLIVVPQEISQEMVPFIARYANTQNRISEADFFSNSPFHIRMEEISKRVTSGPKPGEISPTKWFYERARGSYLNEKNKLVGKTEIGKFEKTYPRFQVITKTDLAKYHNSWNLKPHFVSKGAQKNFVDFANEVADGFSNPETRSDFGDDFYKREVCYAIIFQAAHKAIRSSDWYETGYLANIVTYAMARISLELKNLKLEPDWNQIWRFGEISESFIDALVETAKSMAKVLNDPTRQQKNVSEWAKLEKCWAQAKSTSIVLPEEWLKTLSPTNADQNREVKSEERARGRILNEVEMYKKLSSIPFYVWDEILSSGRMTVSVTQANIIKLYRDGKIPSAKQFERISEVLTKAKEEGLIANNLWD